MMDRKAADQARDAYLHPKPNTREWVGRDLDIQVFTKWGARDVLASDGPDAGWAKQLADAEAAIAAISHSAALAGLLTVAEVNALLGEDEAAAMAVVSLLRGGVAVQSFVRRKDGSTQRRSFGPGGEEVAPFQPKAPKEH